MSAPSPVAAGATRMARSERAGSAREVLAATTAASVLAVAAAVHAYWALGGRWGAAAAYGSTDLPPCSVVAIVTVLIAAGAALLLARAGRLRLALPVALLRWGPWAMAAVIALAGVNNLLEPRRHLRPRLAHLVLRPAAPARRAAVRCCRPVPTSRQQGSRARVSRVTALRRRGAGRREIRRGGCGSTTDAYGSVPLSAYGCAPT